MLSIGMSQWILARFDFVQLQYVLKPLSPNLSPPSPLPPPVVVLPFPHPQCFIAINTSSICPGYSGRLDHLVGQLHALPTAASAPGPVLVPGEKEQATARRQRETGVRLHRNVAERLAFLATKLALTPIKELPVVAL
jgi:hypothetical protein